MYVTHERFEDDDPLGPDSLQRDPEPIYMPLPLTTAYTDIPSSSNAPPLRLPTMVEYENL